MAMTDAEIDASQALIQTAMDEISQFGKSQSMRGRSLTRADLPELRDQYDWLEKQRVRNSRGGIRSRQVVPRG